MSAASLLIDLGNTRLKWALAVDGRLAQEPQALVWPGQPLPIARWRSAGVGRIGLASVGSAAAAAELAHALSGVGVPIIAAETQAQWQGLRCAYAQPRRLGVDRWLALIAAYRAYPQTACLVVSAGTALTLDLLDPGGRHRGGVIAPGLAAMRAGLIAAAPGLAQLGEGVARDVVATDSADAIASGCLQAALGLLARNRRGDGSAVARTLVLSGGDAPVLAPHIEAPRVLSPWLVLEGLAAWLQDADATAGSG